MQPPLYFKTTQEMLEEFSYLGDGEVPRRSSSTTRAKIAGIRWTSVQLFPKHPKGEDTFQPFWPDAADNIRNYDEERHARRVYGDKLPEIVVARLDKELKSILGYGFGDAVQHRAEAGQKVQRGRLSGRLRAVQRRLVPRVRACGRHHRRSTRCRRITAARIAARAIFDVDKSKYKVGVDLPR